MPPSEPPRSSRPKRRKPKPRAAQPPSSTARQGAAFGSKPARPLPKPRPAPRPRPVAQPRAGTTPSPVRVVTKAARAQRPAAPRPSAQNAQAYVSQGKAVSRAAYQQKTVKQRRQTLKKAWATPKAQRTAEQQAAVSVHHERAAGRPARIALAQRDAIVSSAAAVASAATAADRAAAKVAKAKPKEPEKPIKVGGINTHVQPSVARLVAKHIPHVKDIVPLFDQPHQEAPAEAALKNLDRGRNAVATALKQSIKQQGVKGTLFGNPTKAQTRANRKAFVRGLKLKEKTSGSDVLKTAGVKNKTVRALGGFALDTVVASATLPAGGVGSSAARAGETAAVKAAAKGGRFSRPVRAAARGAREGAAARGASRGAQKAAAKQARRVAAGRAQVLAARKRAAAIAAHEAGTAPTRPARMVAKVAPKSKAAARTVKPRTGQGVGVRYLGHEIPGTRRATAAVGRGVRKATKSGAAPTEAERSAARGFAHAERSARGGKEQAAARAKRVARQAVRDLTPEEHQQVIHALDTGNIKSLGNPKLIKAATDLRSAFRHEFKAERQAGVSEVRHPEDFLTGADKEKLAASAAKQVRRADKGVQRVVQAERDAAAHTERTASEAALRHSGREAVGRQRTVGTVRAARDQAKVQLRDELRKPIVKRRGVAALHTKVNRLNAELAAARASRAEAPRTVGAREVAAGERHAERIETVAEHEARRAAAKNLPQRGRGAGVPITETHAAWLKRVHAHADKHDLPLVRERVEKLLAKQPKAEDVARGYFPREFADRAEQQAGVAAKEAPPEGGARAVRGKTSRTVTPATGGQARTDPRRFDILQAERKAAGKDPLSENVPLVAGSRIRSAGRATAESDFARNLAAQGRRVTHESQVKPGEKLYVLGRRSGKYGLHPVDKVPRSAEREWNAYHTAVAKARTLPHPDAAEPGSPEFRDAINKVNRVQSLVDRGATPGERAAARAAQDRALARHHLRLRNGKIEAARDTGESIPRPKPMKGRGERGQHYAIPEHLVERMNQANKPVPAIDSRAIRLWDKGTAAFKIGATYNPAFHLRNAYGDVLRLMEMPGNPISNVSKLGGGRTAARAVRQSERYRQAPGKILKTDPYHKATIKVAGKDMPARDFVDLLRRHKLVDVGRAQQERHEAALLRGDFSGQEGNVLRGGKWTGGLRTRGGPLRGAVGRTFSQDTPNAIRAAAFKAGLDMGMTPAQAADRAHKFFVDYGRLSAAERQIGRRIFPFYTWTAKSLPVTLANYALHPARYENLNNAREEWNQSVTGLSSDELAAQMKGFTRNNLPIVIPLGGGKFAAVSASWPANLIQFAPSGIGPKAFLDEAGRFRALGGSQLNWIAKSLIDGASAGLPGGGGFDLKTGKPIENPDRPRVPAPSWAADLPDWAKKDLLVSTGPDSVSGKKILKWRGWAQWALRAQPVSLARQATGFADTARQGKINTPAAKVAEFLGVNVEDLGPDITKANQQIKLYQRSAELNKKIHQLPEGVGKDNPTPEWRRLRDELNAIQRKIRPNKSIKTSLLSGSSTGPSVPLLPETSTGPQKSLLPGG